MGSPSKTRRPSFSLPSIKDAIKGASVDMLKGRIDIILHAIRETKGRPLWRPFTYSSTPHFALYLQIA
ncbi:hypothetical protein E4T56_gene20658 [Termitomyces sp. T112]|nr:hypothetical protein E4T56_gene20658 [Termitomyces sp. T112]